jgi:hypothetical protein
MSLDYVEKCLDSLEGWPNRVGIMGGEPLLHPEFPEICKTSSKNTFREKRFKVYLFL